MREKEYNTAMVIVVLILVGLLLTAALFYKGDRLKEKIAEMQGQNKELKKQNQQLESKIKQLNLTIDSSNKKLVILYEQDTQLHTEYESAQKSIKNLSTQYEKANTYSHNYNADSVRIYFSNL